jgi:hypothetical protein
VIGDRGGVDSLARECGYSLLVAMIAVGMLGLGCARRTTGPRGPAKLPAMSLWENPIADSSPIYSDAAADMGGQSEFSITFPESAFTHLDRVDDIWLNYRVDYCPPVDVSAYNVCETAWHPIEIWPGSNLCPGFTIPRWSPWLLSCFVSDPVRCFFDTARTLKVRGDLWPPQARLLRYRDDYASVVVSLDRYPYGSLGHDGRSVWAIMSERGGDSVFVFDSSGLRQRELWLSGIVLEGMAWSGSGFWVVEARNPPRISFLSSDGTLTNGFTVPVGYWDTIRGGIAWADSLIWLPRCLDYGGYPDSPIMEMIAIDPMASLKSGEAVIVRKVPAPGDFRDMAGLTSGNGELIVVTGGMSCRLYRMPLNGSIDEGRALELAAGPIAWDGESVWMLHSGPISSPTGGSLLSRFSL